MKRNYISLPSEDIPTTTIQAGDSSVSNNSYETLSRDFTIFDRLFFLTVILCSVFPGPILPSEALPTELSNKESLSKNAQLSKPQYMLSVALQCLVKKLINNNYHIF